MTIVAPEPDRSTPPDAETVEAGGPAPTIDVLEPGPFTTVQDAPGRVGYWHVGVPPNGPMDELSHHLVNRVVGNVESAATLELTGSGPTLRFPTETVVALGGAAMPLTVGGRAAPRWVPVTVPAGSVVEVGANVGPGLRSYLAVRGGLDTVPYLGSRATFTLGGFGGHDGRALEAGDVLPLGADVATVPSPLGPGVAPMLTNHWALAVVIGPHGAPDFL